MPGYRLYHLHPDHGHITGADDLHAADDAAALHAVRQQGHDVPVELWSGARKVSRLDVPSLAACWPDRRGEALG